MVKDIKQRTEEKKQIQAETSKDTYIVENPKPIIDSINELGRVIIKFSEDMYLDEIFRGYTLKTNVAAAVNDEI